MFNATRNPSGRFVARPRPDYTRKVSGREGTPGLLASQPRTAQETSVSNSIVLAALAAVVLAGPAQAAGFTSPTPALGVSYADLDLGTAAGRQVFAGRVHAAAVQVCGKAEYVPGRGIAQYAADRAGTAVCVASAEARARARIAALAPAAESARIAAARP